MKISEVQIHPIKPRDGLVAFGSVVIDDNIYLGSIGIHKKINGSGYRITYPTKKVGTSNLNIFHPINRKSSELIEKSLIARAEKILKI